ncbi:GPR/FUN34 family protein [Glonium stellatum]|uniref:GPR/FUN34 family protein n=1 Tax=Glonium stellatum TaxID=574774 RepID=A0A8E2F477_9PEZI|nr:GPR/FUN34 family protein [Glonium stellatum]
MRDTKRENGDSPSSDSIDVADWAKENQNQAFRSHDYGFGPYGGNPLARIYTRDSNQQWYPAFGGEFQPGSYSDQRSKRGIANPAPMGLSGFALTTFILSLINLGTRGLVEPNLVVGAAYVYGGLVQLLAGMWEMAVGNTFGATALSSYGGFWISFGIILTPGGFNIIEAYGGATAEFANAFGLYLIGWFIFTFILWVCTLRSTVAFCSLFLFVWLTFLMLGIAHLDNTAGAANVGLVRAGGAFGIIAAFLAWYNALAGIADQTNSFFVIPVAHFPWSEKGKDRKQQKDAEKEA